MIINSDTIDMTQGAVLAVHCTGHIDDLTNFSVSYSSDMESLVSLVASPSASPAPSMPAPALPLPMYGGPEDDDYDGGDPTEIVSNSQYTLLGAILGVIATLIYYQIVKMV